MISTKEINFKKKYFQILREFNRLATDIECERCPMLGRNCCSACRLIRKKVNKSKQELMDEGMYNEKEETESTN